MLDSLSRTVHAVPNKPATGRTTSSETSMTVSYLETLLETNMNAISRVCLVFLSAIEFFGVAPASRQPEPRN